MKSGHILISNHLLESFQDWLVVNNLFLEHVAVPHVLGLAVHHRMAIMSASHGFWVGNRGIRA